MTTNLVFSSKLNRFVRQDAPEELGRPTREFLDMAVQEGDAESARRWLDYYLAEQAAVVYVFNVWNWHMARYYLEHKPGASLGDLVRASMAPWVGTTAGLKGHPVATVTVDGPNARLSVPGLDGDLYLTEGNQRYLLTRDTPEAQDQRRARWRASIEAAIDRFDHAEVSRLLDHYLVSEAWLTHDILADWAWALLSLMAREWGEAALDEILRVTQAPWITVRYQAIREMSTEESLQLTIEGMRGHFTGPNRAGQIHVANEADRYVLSFDACGSGGRMRRGDKLVGSGSRLDAPYHFVNIEQAFDWTWNTPGVCAYCAHCSVVNQILPIENLGYPMRMVEYPQNPDDPCRWIIYKDPRNYPAKAYSDVGKTKPGT